MMDLLAWRDARAQIVERRAGDLGTVVANAAKASVNRLVAVSLRPRQTLGGKPSGA